MEGGVQGCCSGCSGSCLPLGGVRVLSMEGAVQGARGDVRVLSRVLSRGLSQGALDHVCHWAVSGCCPACCAGVLFRVLRIMFAIGVSGCC